MEYLAVVLVLASPIALVWALRVIMRGSRDRAATRKEIADGYRYREATRQIWARRRNNG
jgi:hypothetical protein